MVQDLDREGEYHTRGQAAAHHSCDSWSLTNSQGACKTKSGCWANHSSGMQQDGTAWNMMIGSGSAPGGLPGSCGRVTMPSSEGGE